MHFLIGHDHPVRCLNYAASGRLLASADQSGRILVWDLHTGASIREIRAAQAIEAVAFHPCDEAQIVGALPDGRIQTWHPAKAQPPAEGLHLNRIRHLTYTPSGKQLLAVGDMRDRQGTLAFRWGDGGYLYRRGGHGLALSPSGGDVASSSDTGSIFVWHSDTPLDVERADFRYKQRLSGHTNGVASVLAFSRDGRSLYSVLGSEVIVWDLALGNPRSLPALPSSDRPLCFSPDGTRLLTTDAMGVLRVYDTTLGMALTALDWEIGPPVAVIFSPDGMTAAAVGKVGPVVVWDVEE